MARNKRTGVRQAFMKRSFMRSRTTAIFDCWPDPLAGACSGFQKPITACSNSQGRDSVYWHHPINFPTRRVREQPERPIRPHAHIADAFAQLGQQILDFHHIAVLDC